MLLYYQIIQCKCQMFFLSRFENTYKNIDTFVRILLKIKDFICSRFFEKKKFLFVHVTYYPIIHANVK